MDFLSSLATPKYNLLAAEGESLHLDTIPSTLSAKNTQLIEVYLISITFQHS